MSNLIKLQNWYSSQCNGDWEHSYGIKIDTLDNPGWSIVIDLADTKYENLELISLNNYSVNYYNEENDWYTYAIENSKFIACGDSNKLDMLIGIFLNIVELIN